MNTTTYGLDIAKTVFQLYWVELSGKAFQPTLQPGEADGVPGDA
ncbi:hypothetical protein LMG23994_02490 [Cupriavidus pinatubonensis]|uniref:Transposase n=1 Tax=Cupriavidus pinatubonensis TaxID=248026 RepID=A0ABN7YHD7_9BURK|nr:hypothetical protein LMG23994_02490 [Cupriavidus pinatubonensis]